MGCRLIQMENGQLAIIAKKAPDRFREELQSRIGPDEAAVEIPEAQLVQALRMILTGHQDVEVK